MIDHHRGEPRSSLDGNQGTEHRGLLSFFKTVFLPSRLDPEIWFPTSPVFVTVPPRPQQGGLNPKPEIWFSGASAEVGGGNLVFRPEIRKWTTVPEMEQKVGLFAK
jgi:hypothetical protein